MTKQNNPQPRQVIMDDGAKTLLLDNKTSNRIGIVERYAGCPDSGDDYTYSAYRSEGCVPGEFVGHYKRRRNAINALMR
ncbi:MAG: hypothetical protein ACR2PR_11205 [Pseudohongiellaceae bacterium]